MFELFKQKNQKELEILHNRLTNSFANVKGDISNLSQTIRAYQQWIDYLNQRIKIQESQINALLHRIEQMPKSHLDIRKVIDEHYRLDGLVSRVEELNNRLNGVLESNKPIFERMANHHERLTRLEQGREKKPNFREKIIQKISKNSKEYVKGLILSLIRKYEKVSALQLREIVVEEQGLCSKSSFYRLLEELEKSDELEVFQEGKEKFYMHRIYSTKRHQ
jgi:uncharacterized protein YoxC